MSSFAAKGFDAENYANLRPTYPDSFYELLNNFHKGDRNLAIDVGCGPGTATFQLAGNLTGFKKIIGTDVSQTMVERAKVEKAKVNKDILKCKTIEFIQSPGESFDFLGTNDEMDMITAAESAHYFDFDKFQQNVSKNLSKGGTWAIWGYGDFFFPDYPKLDDALNRLMYDDDKLGPYWSQPGRTIATEMLKDCKYNPEHFTDIEEVYFHKKDLNKIGNVNSASSAPIYMHRTSTLKEISRYTRTWSAYYAWRKCNVDATDIVDWFTKEAKRLYPELKDDSELTIVWPTFYKLGRKL